MCTFKTNCGVKWLFAFALVSCATQSAWDNPERILGVIHEIGPPQTIARMTAGDREPWETALRHIENGEAQWLEVARVLRSGTDAVTTTELRFAVARALPKAPREVLSLVGRGLQLEDICLIPFIETESTVELAYLNHTKEALLRLNAAPHDENRLRCLEFVEQQIALYQK